MPSKPFRFWRDDHPSRSVAREDRGGGMEARRIVEGPGIDRVPVVLAALSAKNETAANGTGTTHGAAAPGGSRGDFSCLSLDAQGARRKSHERNESRARRLAAIAAVAIGRVGWLAACFIPQCPAKTAAGVVSLSFIAFHLRALRARAMSSASCGSSPRWRREPPDRPFCRRGASTPCLPFAG